MNTSRSLLEIRDLSIYIDSKSKRRYLVKNLNLCIKKGEIYSLVGESGSGKTLTSLSIAQLLPNNIIIDKSSYIFLNNVDLLNFNDYEMNKIRGRKISMIFQEPMMSLNPTLTIGQQIIETIKEPLSKKEKYNLCIDILNEVGMKNTIESYNQYPHQMSGGMRQRVMIAIALINKPDLIIADEPTTALDVTIENQILNLLLKLKNKYNISILIITHDLSIASRVADKVGIMYGGSLVEEIYGDIYQGKHPYTYELINSRPSFEKRGIKLHNSFTNKKPDVCSNKCKFINRCTHKLSICNQKMPPKYSIDFSTVRCFLYNNNENYKFNNINNRINNTIHTNIQCAKNNSHLNITKMNIGYKKNLFGSIIKQENIVSNFNISLPNNRTIALVGESGCGKTSIAKATMNLINSSDGTVEFVKDDTTINNKEKIFYSNVQMVFQDSYSSLNPKLMIYDILYEGIKLNSKSLDPNTILNILNDVGLEQDDLYKYPHEFSGGQKQRISIARALVTNPRFIILDEPTSALDISIQANILNLLNKIKNDKNISYLFITHDLSVVSYFADDVIVMYMGQIMEKGSVEQIYTNAQHPYTKSLMKSAININNPVNKIPSIIPNHVIPAGFNYFPKANKNHPHKVHIENGHYINCFHKH